MSPDTYTGPRVWELKAAREEIWNAPPVPREPWTGNGSFIEPHQRIRKASDMGVGPRNFPGSRRAPCLCGSGKSWKRCCGKRERNG